MTNLMCDRVALVTGGGRGLGRAHALALASEGAQLVIADLAGSDDNPAADLAAEIEAMGGKAIAVNYDVADEDGAAGMVADAVAQFGDLHAVVNNAGILRDRMLINMSVDEWDAVVRVHLRGTFLVTRAASQYWRSRAKSGASVSGRVVNTTSAAGLYGNVGQANYGAAKAGIAGFTIIAAAELARYGITVNALSPTARTRMTETLFADMMTPKEGEFDFADPANASPLVAWLCSEVSGSVTGRTFSVLGGKIIVSDGWQEGPSIDLERRWSVDEVAAKVPSLVEQAPAPMPVFGTAPAAKS